MPTSETNPTAAPETESTTASSAPAKPAYSPSTEDLRRGPKHPAWGADLRFQPR